MIWNSNRKMNKLARVFNPKIVFYTMKYIFLNFKIFYWFKYMTYTILDKSSLNLGETATNYNNWQEKQLALEIKIIV